MLYQLCLAALAIALFASPALGSDTRIDEDDFPGAEAAFKLEGTNGYSVGFSAFSDRSDGRGRIFISVFKRDGAAFYSAPAIVSEAFVRADLGRFGRVDVALRPSGPEKKIHIKCSRYTYAYEPRAYEGVVEFKGERGYTRARATQGAVAVQLTSFCSGSGSGESSGPGLPGARLRGVSYAHGRTLTFQVNKNHPKARMRFNADLKERHGEIWIYRAVEGFAPAGGFRFDPKLQTARLSPPAPFSGSAALARNPYSSSPRWTGDLALDFPGRKVRLAGPGVHVSLVPARYTRGDNGSATVGISDVWARPSLFAWPSTKRSPNAFGTSLPLALR